MSAILDSGPPNVNFWAQEQQQLLSGSHGAATTSWATPYDEQGTKDVNNQTADAGPR